MDKGEQQAIDEMENEYKEAMMELVAKVEDTSFLDSIIDEMGTLPAVKKLLKSTAKINLIYD